MQTLTKAERLSGKVVIEKLFTTGEQFYSKPMKVYWLSIPLEDEPVKLLISVPKRIFKRAVDRNKIKRLIREAYRKNKEVLIEQVHDKSILLMFIYLDRKILPYTTIEKRIVKALNETVKEIDPKK